MTQTAGLFLQQQAAKAFFRVGLHRVRSTNPKAMNAILSHYDTIEDFLAAVVETDFKAGRNIVAGLADSVINVSVVKLVRAAANSDDLWQVIKTYALANYIDLGFKEGIVGLGGVSDRLTIELQLALGSEFAARWLREDAGDWWEGDVAVDTLAQMIVCGFAMNLDLRAEFLSAVGARELLIALQHVEGQPHAEQLADVFVVVNGGEAWNDAFFRLVPVEAMVRVSDRAKVWEVICAMMEEAGRLVNSIPRTPADILLEETELPAPAASPCGETETDKSAEPRAPQSVVTADNWRCSSCGTLNSTTLTACGECGVEWKS